MKILKQISSNRWIRIGLLCLALLLAPFVVSDFQRFIMMEVFMWGLFAVGFDIIFGKAGLLNFGMGSFFGLGSYAFVLVIHHLGSNIWVGLLAAIILSMIFSYLLGLIVTRFSSHYFVVFSIITSTILFLLAMNLRWLTGGDEGINIRLKVVPLIFGELSLKDPVVMYFFILVVTAVVFAVILRFFKSPLGLAIEAVKQNEERAEMLGYNTKALKLIAFTLSGTIAGLAGGIYPVLNSNTNAGLFFWLISGNAILWTVVGGTGTLWGCFLGTAILVYAEDILSSWLVNFYPILVGGLLIVIILVAPKGILGSLEDYLRKRRNI